MGRVIKQVTLIVLTLVCVSFFIYVIFSRGEDGKLEIFADMPGIIEKMQSNEPINQNANLAALQGSGGAPVLSYAEGAQYKGTSMKFKALFDVTTEAGTWPGETENGFAIFLQDIKDSAGNSRLTFLDTASLESTDEIIDAFVYDYEQDVLYIHGSGVYTVYVKVYGITGVALYAFALPVEEGGGA